MKQVIVSDLYKIGYRIFEHGKVRNGIYFITLK